jgi:hypothetical protein
MRIIKFLGEEKFLDIHAGEKILIVNPNEHSLRISAQNLDMFRRHVHILSNSGESYPGFYNGLILVLKNHSYMGYFIQLGTWD